jgi:hypothetical protein
MAFRTVYVTHLLDLVSRNGLVIQHEVTPGSVAGATEATGR